MKKILLIALSLMMVFALVSCASTKKEAKAENEELVLYQNSFNDMPKWAVEAYSDDTTFYGWGYAKMSNRQNSIKKAQSDARTNITERVFIAVDEIVTNYVNDAGEDSDRQALDAFETLSRQRASAVLSDSAQKDMYIDQEGGVYILMGIPAENVKSQMYGAAEEASKKFVKNEAAAEANRMMNDAIAKYFGN